jgi:hypothetical protein
LVAIAALVACACSRERAHSQRMPELPGGVLISQFYARDPDILEGQSTVLCYQVENARSVEIAPPVAELRPTPLPRCITVTPDRNTTYFLTAADGHGAAVRESALVRVHPDIERLPAISYFTKTQKPSPDGRLYLLCFAVQNAKTVEVTPPVMLPSEAPMGCFYVHPSKTTTYVLTARGARGRKAQDTMYVEVSP